MAITRDDLYNAYLKFFFSLKKRISLYERLEQFLEAGIDVVNALTSIRNRYAKAKDFRAKIMDRWLQALAKGQRFENAIRPWIPATEHMLISAGERGEGLRKGLKEATVMSMASARTKAAIIAGTMYPLALVGMLFGMLIMFQTKMAPVFITLKPLASWPSSGKTLYNVSYFVQHYLWVVVLGLFSIAMLIGMTMGRWRGRIRRVFDYLPPWSVYRGYMASSFLIGLSSLMTAGVANYDALTLMRRTAMPWMRDHLEKMMAMMALGGTNQGEALDTGLLDKEVAGDVQDYSRLGSFQMAIQKLGARALEEGVKVIEARMAIVKNVMLVAVVATVAWIYMTSYLLQGDIAASASQRQRPPASAAPH